MRPFPLVSTGSLDRANQPPAAVWLEWSRRSRGGSTMLWLAVAVALSAVGGAVVGAGVVSLGAAWAGTKEPTAKKLRDGAIFLGIVVGVLLTVYVWALGLAIRLVPVSVSVE